MVDFGFLKKKEVTPKTESSIVSSDTAIPPPPPPPGKAQITTELPSFPDFDNGRKGGYSFRVS